ncbi:MAG: delta-60 repeat domain-containing protein [bacterium]
MDIYSVAIQNDGKIIVGGATEVVRLNSGGSMDTSFTSI